MTPASRADWPGFQVLGLLLEVGAGGGVDPVGAPAEVHRVHVELEDLVLGELALQLDRDHGLLELAEQGPVAADAGEGVLDVLLGDGRAALGDPAAQQVGRARPGQPAPGDRPVLVEVAVLGGQHRPAGVLGDLVQRDHPAVLLGREGADLLPAGRVEEHDRLGGRHLGGQGHAGEGVDQPDDRARGDGHGRHGQPQRPAQDPPEAGAGGRRLALLALRSALLLVPGGPGGGDRGCCHSDRMVLHPWPETDSSDGRAVQPTWRRPRR